MKDGQWWDKSITLIEGCTPVSEGCSHCWSAGMTHRFHQNRGLTTNGHFNGKIVCREDRLGEILKRKKPTRWVIWNDLWHPSVPFGFIDKVMAVFNKCPQHTGQILTKRPERMLEYRQKQRFNPWPDNIIGMVTAENQKMADIRIPLLLQCGFKTTGVSIEPMLGPVDLDYIKDFSKPNRFTKYERIYSLTGERSCLGHRMTEEKLDQVIVGGESGPGARPMSPGWPRGVRDQCVAADVPFFFKQWGGINKKKAGRSLDGRKWNEMPKELNNA